MPRGSDPIKKVVLPSGEVRFRFTVDVGKKVKTDKSGQPVTKDGKPVMVRDQRTHSYEKRKDAVDKRAALLADKARGTLVASSKMKLGQHLGQWLAGKRDLKRRTYGNYRDALSPSTRTWARLSCRNSARPTSTGWSTRCWPAGGE